MQLLEASVLGVRAARLRLRSSTLPVSVTLYPMIHVGEADFFEQVYAEAFSHDVVLVEGVRSRLTKRFTRSYEWINFEKLGLVVQPRTPSPDAVSAKIIHADLTGPEFEAEWRKVPMGLRLTVLVLVPFVGLKRRLFASRESLADRMSLEDRRSADEVLSWDPEWAALEHSLLGARDARLVQRLGEQLDEPAPEQRRLAVVFGAMHMRAVLAELNRRGFRTVESEWLTVFRL